jgi:hypothetical protein
MGQRSGGGGEVPLVATPGLALRADGGLDPRGRARRHAPRPQHPGAHRRRLPDPGLRADPGGVRHLERRGARRDRHRRTRADLRPVPRLDARGRRRPGPRERIHRPHLPGAARAAGGAGGGAWSPGGGVGCGLRDHLDALLRLPRRIDLLRRLAGHVPRRRVRLPRRSPEGGRARRRRSGHAPARRGGHGEARRGAPGASGGGGAARAGGLGRAAGVGNAAAARAARRLLPARGRRAGGRGRPGRCVLVPARHGRTLDRRGVAIRRRPRERSDGGGRPGRGRDPPAGTLHGR